MARYWFSAKRHGWGWGPPSAWQGWAALALFVVLIALGAILFSPSKSLLAYLAYVVAVAAALLLVCWLKGEPPRWR